MNLFNNNYQTAYLLKILSNLKNTIKHLIFQIQHFSQVFLFSYIQVLVVGTVFLTRMEGQQVSIICPSTLA